MVSPRKWWIVRCSHGETVLVKALNREAARLRAKTGEGKRLGVHRDSILVSVTRDVRLLAAQSDIHILHKYFLTHSVYKYGDKLAED